MKTYNIKAASAIAAGTHEGFAVTQTAANEADLCGTAAPCGLIVSIDDSAGTMVVAEPGEDAWGAPGATITIGTHKYLMSAADSRLDPATAGNYVVAIPKGDADGVAESGLIPVRVHIFELDS